MKLNYNRNASGIILFAIILALIAAHLMKFISFSLPVLLGAVMLIYAIPTLYFSMEKGRRKEIILSVVLFFTGAILFIIKRYDILSPLVVVFPSAVFITGMVFIFLFIDNTDEKHFLYSGLSLAAAGIILALTYRHLPFHYLIDRIIGNIADYWHIILIALGITMLILRKKS